MDSWGWGWIPMLIMMTVFLVLAVWVVLTLVRRGPHPIATGERTLPPGDQARRILDERFARGEIDDDEYSRRRRTLEGG
jgi:putative membrane protein